MRKRILSVLAICAIIACLFSACSIDNSQPGEGRGVGYVTFGNQLTSNARSLTPSYDVAAYEDLYWFYDAAKQDSYGMTGAGKNQKIPGTDGKGLAGEVGPFSQGTWNFTLYAYSGATLSGDSWTPTEGTLVYQGETGNVVITAGAVTNIPVSVEPQGETGIVKFGDNAYFTWANGGGDGKPVIKFILTRTDVESNPIEITATLADNYVDGKLMLSGVLSNTVAVGYYNCHISAYLDGYESTPLAEQEISFRVYGSAAVIIDGDITEGVNSYVSFDVADTSMEVFSGNAGEVTVNDVTVDFSGAGLDEASTHYLTLESVSGTSAESLYQSASSVPEDEDDRIAVTSLDLTLSQVTSDNNQSTVTTFSEPVTVTTTVASGLENVTVVYDGEGEQPQDVSYTASTGELSFKTSHFSRFYVLADSRVLNVEKGAYYASLADAIDDVDDGETIQLADDIVLHNQIVFSNREFTLDLAGHSIKPSNDLVLTSGVIYLKNDVNMTIEDSVGTGSIDMRTERLDANNQYAAIYAAVALMPEGEHSSSLTVKGGTLAAQYYAIAGNGSSDLGETTITINGGTLISEDGPSIYHPQRGVLTVNDGTLTATDSAIELRSGTLVINGGTFTATASPASTAPNGSGTTTKGAAIAIAQHTTKFPINVVINGGSFNGFHAFYEHTPQADPALDVISIQINGGTFNATNVSTMPVYSEDFAGFIYGGTFSPAIDEKYVASGFKAEHSGNEWVVSSIFEGSGSESDPYQIGSSSQLGAFADAVNSGNGFKDVFFVLTDDIDLAGEEWTPIGKSTRSGSGLAEGSTPFEGVFDGQGHSITGLKVTQGAEDDGIGLFSALSGEGAAIRNLKVSGSVENSASGAAALVVGFVLDNACVENVETLEGSTVSANEGAGIVGRMLASGTISNAVNRASVETVGGKAAGIVFAAYYDQYPGETGKGQTYDDFKVVDCVNYGAIESNSNCIGGIVGIATTVSIEDCINYGSVTGGGYGIGGIAGELKHGAAIIRCVNNGSVTSEASSSASFGIGGLAGWIRYDDTASDSYNDLLVSRIEDSENHGDVTTSGNTGIGGAIGHIYNAATISGTKNYGNVTLTSKNGLMIGGFVGGLQAEKSSYSDYRNTISFTDCYTDADAVSAPEGTTNEGDFVGHPNAPTAECQVSVLFTDCFCGDTSYTWSAE